MVMVMTVNELILCRTLMRQECRVSVNMYGGSYLEGAVTSSVAANAAKGRQAIDHVINAVDAEITDMAKSFSMATSVWKCDVSNSVVCDHLSFRECWLILLFRSYLC